MRRLGIFAAVLCGLAAAPVIGQYHTYPELEAALQTAAANYPLICRRENLGVTNQGRTMWAVCISANVNTESDEPEFRFMSTIHGDEPVGEENCLNLVNYLTSNYGVDSRVTNLINSMEIWILPCLNPDGFVAITRGNANGVDINRDFPDPYTSTNNTTAGRQTETGLIMNWTWAHSFTLSANLHGGSLVVNYPWDANPNGQSVYTTCPDDDLFIVISEKYSQFNLPMWNSTGFLHGITNGADWYHVNGGLQDWGYRYCGVNEVTIELGDTKRPAAAQLPTYWNDNRESMLSYMEQTLIGVRGLVTDALSGAPLAASVTVVGRDHKVYTDPQIGDYHRMVLPGSYSLQVEATGYDPATVTGIAVGSGAAMRADVALWRTRLTSPNGGEFVHAGIPAAAAWQGNPAAAFQVQYSANYGSTQAVADGFETGVFDAAYTTGGNANWRIVTTGPHAGTRSASPGAIGNSQTSWLQRTVGPGSLSFWYRVSSEANYDFFDVYVDSVRVVHVSGAGSWTQYSTTLGAGNHDIRWQYTKDGSQVGGSDTAWLDDLTFVADATTWADVVPLTTVGQMTANWTPPAPTLTGRLRVRSVYSGPVYGPWDLSDAPFTVCRPGDLNQDLSVTLTGDLAAFMGQLLGDPPGSAYAQCAADVNGDGQIDGRDIQGMVRALLGS